MFLVMSQNLQNQTAQIKLTERGMDGARLPVIRCKVAQLREHGHATGHQLPGGVLKRATSKGAGSLLRVGLPPVIGRGGQTLTMGLHHLSNPHQPHLLVHLGDMAEDRGR